MATLIDQVTDGSRIKGAGWLILLLLCFAMFLSGIAALPPTDRDESSFAQATRQMIETGNYVDIRLQDEPRYQKPIGIYWLQAASVRLFNPQHLDEIWAYRLPSFIGMTIAVLMTAALGVLLFDARVGFLAAFMLASCLIVNVEARLAKTDAFLLAVIVIVQYGLAVAYRREAMQWSTRLAFWTALGVGILIKGPMVLLPLVATLLWLWRRDRAEGASTWQWLRVTEPALGLPWMLLIVVPWFVAIMQASHGAFAEQSAGHDLLAKIWQGQNRGIVPPGAHALLFPLIFFPSSLFALLALPDAWRLRRQPSYAFLWGWILPTWIVFELSLTKLPHYTMPVFPALALLAAKALCDGYPVLRQKLADGGWLRVWPVCAIFLWVVVGFGVAVAGVALPAILEQMWLWPQVIVSAVLVIIQAVVLYRLMVWRDLRAPLLMALGSLLFMGLAFGYTVPGIKALWMSRQIVTAVRSVQPCARMQIIAASYNEPSLVFMGGTHSLLLNDGAAAAQALQRDHCAVAVVDDKRRQDFLAAFTGGEPRLALTIEGLNMGHGRPAHYGIYTLP